MVVRMDNGADGAEKRGFWRLLWRSWWLLPVLHVTLFWGGCAATAATGMTCEAVPGLDKDKLWTLVFGISWLLGMATAVLLPVAVIVQLARRQWKTALATVLFSAAALAPFVWLIWKLSGRGLC